MDIPDSDDEDEMQLGLTSAIDILNALDKALAAVANVQHPTL